MTNKVWTNHVCQNSLLVNDDKLAQPVLEWLGQIVHQHLQHSREVDEMVGDMIEATATKIGKAIDPQDIASYFEVSQIAEQFELDDIANCFDSCDLAEQVAQFISSSDIAKELDHKQIAEEITGSDVMDDMADDIAKRAAHIVTDWMADQEQQRIDRQWHRRLLAKCKAAFSKLRKQGGK